MPDANATKLAAVCLYSALMASSVGLAFYSGHQALQRGLSGGFSCLFCQEGSQTTGGHWHSVYLFYLLKVFELVELPLNAFRKVLPVRFVNLPVKATTALFASVQQSAHAHFGLDVVVEWVTSRKLDCINHFHLFILVSAPQCSKDVAVRRCILPSTPPIDEFHCLWIEFTCFASTLLESSHSNQLFWIKYMEWFPLYGIGVHVHFWRIGLCSRQKRCRRC